MHTARFLAFIFLISGVAACGGGSGGGGDDGNDGGQEPVVNCSGSGSVSINGVITFERVPVAQDTADTPYLDFADRFESPVRQAKVQAVCPDDGSVYSTTYTDDLGAYELTVPENVSVRIRALAQMNRSSTPAWDVRVVDNMSSNSIWSIAGDTFDSATGSLTVNLFAPSGWSESSGSYASSRSAAPFALLDTVYAAMQKVLDADATADFAALLVNWSPNNSYTSIGTTYYSNGQIYVLGDASQDTDEFDEHIVAHEWGHYFEDKFSRSDSIGGGHTSDDRLDIRVAFGEGWGNAWSGMALGDNVYKDTFATSSSPGGTGFALGLENKADSSVLPDSSGWFDEGSIQRIFYDIYDDTTDVADGDSNPLALGFGPIYDVLTTTQRTTPLMTNLFPFIYGMITTTSVGPELNDRLNADNIANVIDAEGSNRTNTGGASIADKYIIPLFTPVAVNGGAVEICSTDVYTSSTYDGSSENSNKLGTRRFATFSSSASLVTITVDGSANTASNPDFRVFSEGVLVATSTNTNSKIETRGVTLSGPIDDFVIEFWDVLNTNSNETDGQENCYQVSVTG